MMEKADGPPGPQKTGMSGIRKSSTEIHIWVDLINEKGRHYWSKTISELGVQYLNRSTVGFGSLRFK